MTVILPLATVLVIVAASAIAVPLLRSRPALRPAVWTAIACVGIIALGSTVLYAVLSSGAGHKRSVESSSTVGSPESMVEGLAQRLRSHPKDLSGWLMLGRSYTVLKEYPRAVRAYEHAVRLSGGSNTDALLGEARARMRVNGEAITGKAGDLVERALALSPGDPNALYFGAVVALHRGKLALARTRFSKLLALDPPASLRRDVQAQIASIDQQLGRQSAAALPGGQADPGNPSILVHLRLASSLAKRAPPDAPLYVFVRDPKQPGPPLAVKRLTSRFPQTVVLSATDSMVPGHAFTTGERVVVVARVAPSGNPMDESGDLNGRATYRVGGSAPVRILINQVTH